VEIIEKQFEILRHWANDKTLFITFQQILSIGNIPSKITTKYQANCDEIQKLLNHIHQQSQQTGVKISYSKTIEMLIEFTEHLLMIRQLYNQRNWKELENYLNLKFPISLFQSIRMMKNTQTSSATASNTTTSGTTTVAFKESIKEVDNCRWLVKYYNILQSLRDACNEHFNFSLIHYDKIDVIHHTSLTPQTYLINEIFIFSKMKFDAIQQGKEMELHDEPVFSGMLDLCEKSLQLTEYCRDNKLLEVPTYPPTHLLSLPPLSLSPHFSL
jgi:hypothetical protein